ncbi:MAG: hypothetical protein WEE20_05245 [Bacteroidota bacterium]
MKTSLAPRFMLWSMLIFAISVTVMQLRLLYSFELTLLNFPIDVRTMYREPQTEDPDFPFVLFSLWAPLPPAEYVRHAARIVDDLKKAGAKAVLVRLPVDMPWTPKVREQIERIQKGGIAVIGQSLRESEMYARSSQRSLDNPKNWWIRHPVFHHLDLFWGVLSARYEMFGSVYRFVPTQYRDYERGGPVPDASLQLLKRHFGYPDDLEIQQGPYQVRFGSHAIPIAPDGYAYVKRAPLPRLSGGVSASISPETDSLHYSVWASGKNEKEISLETAWRGYKDKVVILDWSGMPAYIFPSSGQVYMQILNAIVTHNFVSRMDEWNLLFVLFFVAIMTGLSFVTRGWIVFVSSILFSIGVVWFSRWLLDQQSILVDPTYILFPILLCGVVLPLIKLSGEKKIAEQTVKELKEELKRLEGVNRG